MATGQDGAESLVKGFLGFNVDEDGGGVDWKPKEDYYVHIDVTHGSSSKVSKAINKHLIKGDAYDPRRAHNFPTDLLEANEPDTLENRRKALGIGREYYELWKVRKTFSLAAFREMVTEISAQQPELELKVRIVRIIDNEHDINVYP